MTTLDVAIARDQDTVHHAVFGVNLQLDVARVQVENLDLVRARIQSLKLFFDAYSDQHDELVSLLIEFE